MASSKINTLILITAARCCRADVGGRGEIVRVWSQGRRGGVGLSESVRVALGLGGSAEGRVVMVLTTEAWTQTLSLHRGQVSGLSKPELEQALAFEAEPFSGLSPLNSVLGACDSGARDGSATFWIVQLARGEREAVQRVVKECGGRLHGIAHPGGVPAPLSAVAKGTAWRRIECWDGAWLLALCEDGRAVQTKVIPTAPDPRDLPAHGTLERLNARENNPFGGDEAVLSLADEDTLKRWFELLAQASEGLPWITAEAPPPSRGMPWLVGATLTAAVVVLSLFQGLWYAREKSALHAVQAEHAAIQPLIDAAGKETVKLKAELAEVQKQQKALERIIQQRAALPELMKALAKHCPENLVVRSIKPERGMMVVGGVALEATAVDELGIVLTAALRHVGLLAQPLQKKARQELAKTGPWDFTLAVMPVEMSAKSQVPPPATADNY